MTPDYCTRCGKRTKVHDPDPIFCGSCGFLLVDEDEAEQSTASVALQRPDSGIPPYSPYHDLSKGAGHLEALGLMMDRYMDAGRQLPLSVGIIIEMGVPVQASLPLHRDMNSQLSDPGRRPLPFNLMTSWRSKTALLWKDAKDRHVSRAGAVAYYWGGGRHGKMWHFTEELDERDLDRLVTTDDTTVDFEMRLKPDMRDLHEESGLLNYNRVLDMGLARLEKYLIEGINTKDRRIDAIGAPIGWVMFGMDELAPEHRSTT